MTSLIVNLVNPVITVKLRPLFSSGFSRSCGMQFPNRLICRKNTRQSDDLEVLSTA